MQDICEFFIEQSRPNTFNIRIKDNIIVRHEKGFENILSSLQESGIETKDITVFEFYSRIEHYEQKYAKIKKNGNQQV